MSEYNKLKNKIKDAIYYSADPNVDKLESLITDAYSSHSISTSEFEDLQEYLKEVYS